MDEWSDEWAPELEPGDELLNRNCPWVVTSDGRVLFGMNGDLHDDLLIEHGLTSDDIKAWGEITPSHNALQLRPGGHEYEDVVQTAWDEDHFDPHTAAGPDEWAPEFNRPAGTSMYKFIHRPATGDIDWQSIHDNYASHDQMIQRYYAPGEDWDWRDWRTGYAEVMPGPRGEPVPKVKMYEHDPILERYAWEQLQKLHPEVQQWPEEAQARPVASPQTPWDQVPGTEDLPAHLGGKRTADYQGMTNWETWNVKLWMDNERETQEISREFVRRGNKQGLIDWAMKHFVIPHNRDAMRDAQEWNDIPREERIDYHLEDMKDRHPEHGDLFNNLFGEGNVDDMTPNLIDPEIINWDEIYQDIENEFAEEDSYNNEDARLREMGIDFGMPGHSDETNTMLDAWLKHHGILTDEQIKQQYPGAPWSETREQSEMGHRTLVPIDQLDPNEFSGGTSGDFWKQNVVPNGGYLQSTREIGWNLLWDIQRGKATPEQRQQMQAALEGQGYSPEQIANLMRVRFRFDPNTNQWEDVERNMDAAPAVDPTLDQPGTLTIPNEWISKTAAPEDWGPIRIDKLEAPFEFRMPQDVEQRFVNSYECPECTNTLRKTEHGAECPYCGWNSALRVASDDWAPAFIQDDDSHFPIDPTGYYAKRRPFVWVQNSKNAFIGENGSYHPVPRPQMSWLGEIWEDTSPARFKILQGPSQHEWPVSDEEYKAGAERALAEAQRAYFQQQDNPEQRQAAQQIGNQIDHADYANDPAAENVDTDEVWDPRTPYLYDPENDLLHWGGSGWWHSDLRPFVHKWEANNGVERTRSLVGGAVLDTPERHHAVYDRTLPVYSLGNGQVNPEHDRVRNRLEELIGSPIERYDNPDTLLQYAQQPTEESSDDWAPRLGADLVPGNEGHWVWLDGNVGFGGEHHEIARTLAQRLGYDPTAVNYISNTIARNGIPEGHQVAVGTMGAKFPQIWNSTVDRNAVWDDVARNYEGFSKSAGIKEDAQRAYESLHNSGGFSLTQSMEAANGAAYFTSYREPTKVIPVQQFSPTDIVQWRHEVLPILQSDPNNLIGGWLENGEVYLDVSRAFQDEQTAVQFGIANGQKAVWDGFNNREIRLDMGQDELRNARLRKLGKSVQWSAPIYSEHLTAPVEKISMGLRGDLPEGVRFELTRDHTGSYDEYYVAAYLPDGTQVGGLTVTNGMISGVEVPETFRRMGIATEMARYYFEQTGQIPQHDWENQSYDGRQWAQWHDPEGLEEHKEAWGDMWDPDDQDPAMLEAIRRAEESERRRLT